MSQVSYADAFDQIDRSVLDTLRLMGMVSQHDIDSVVHKTAAAGNMMRRRIAYELESEVRRHYHEINHRSKGSDTVKDEFF